jgi:hypothetical protein
MRGSGTASRAGRLRRALSGTFLVPRVSLRVEAAFPGPTSITETSSNAIVLTGTGLSEYLSQSSDSNTQSFSALLGFHPLATGRWRVDFLGGVAFNRQSFHAVVTTTIEGLPPLLPARFSSYEANAVSYDPSAIVGSDVAARLSAHLSVVGQVRVLAFASDIHIRPGVVLRWTR